MTDETSFQSAPGAAVPSAQVISLGEVHGDAGANPAAVRVINDMHPLHAVKAALHVRVGRVEVSVGDLLQAREHQVLVLDQGVDQPVDLMLEDKVIARGQLVAVNGSFAIRIGELPVPLKV